MVEIKLALLNRRASSDRSMVQVYVVGRAIEAAAFYILFNYFWRATTDLLARVPLARCSSRPVV